MEEAVDGPVQEGLTDIQRASIRHRDARESPFGVATGCTADRVSTRNGATSGPAAVIHACNIGSELLRGADS